MNGWRDDLSVTEQRILGALTAGDYPAADLAITLEGELQDAIAAQRRTARLVTLLTRLLERGYVAHEGTPPGVWTATDLGRAAVVGWAA